ncbi:MAG: hypothetical protein ACK4UO_10455 [Pseudolabrys sp.]
MLRLVSARVLLPLTAILAVGLAAFAVVERMTLNERAAERRALIARDAELTARALAPGSALACLDAGAGDPVESACEAAVFADAASAARAVAYMAARIALLWDAHALAEAGGPGLDDELAATRRAIALDRFGVAAQALAVREGCTGEACDVFDLLDDAGTLKGNLKLGVFDQYVARHAARWNAAPADKAPAAVSAVPPAPSAAAPMAAAEPAANATPHKQWDYPSAASIPPVSIMNAEPPRPKEADATQAAPPPGEGGGTVPVPPKRPQAPQAAETPPR